VIQKPKRILCFLIFNEAELQDPDPKLFGNAVSGSVYNEYGSATLM
jgi:hypothetical protein